VSAITHRCPVCGALHQVNAARARLAYGRPYTCSFECESKRRRTWYDLAVSALAIDTRDNGRGTGAVFPRKTF
jgi:hypothetical protein